MHGMDRSPQWQAAIDQLYDAVGREQRLAQALDAFRPFFGAQAVSFFTAPDVRHPQSSHTGAAGMSDQMLLEYHAHYSAHDEWVNAAIKRSDFVTGAVYRGTQLVGRRQLQESYFGRTFLVRHGVVDVLATVIETGSSDGPFSFASFHRHRGQPPFTAADAQALSLLGPHMRQVLRLHRRLAPQLAVGATLREMAERLEAPLLFIGDDGRVVDRNPAAQAALNTRSGWLAERGGRLFVCEARRWQDFSTWLPALLRGGREARTSLTLDLLDMDGRSASLEVFPIQAALVDAVARHPAVVICTLKAAPRDRLQALRARHGLTTAEARVVLQLAEGRMPSEIAAAAGVTLATVRSQIAAARSKMGVRRQVQIVSAVLAL